MGGPGKVVEGDGMFVVGKRKCGVGRMHSKEHVYVCKERASRKIRRLTVPDKSANALSAFDKYLLPGTEMHVDCGTENAHFKTLSTVTSISEIPGPIHIDREDPTKNTQSVESSHSGVKMRLRSGRGLARHNLQAVMDLEDFIYNRTNGTPQDIFKKVGDIAAIYCRATHDDTVRHSNIPIALRPDRNLSHILGLNLRTVKRMCSLSVYNKAARYEARVSKIISTQSFPSRNTITGQFRAVKIHDQLITWSPNDRTDDFTAPTRFNSQTFAATCTCKYYLKEQALNGKLCSHVIGQLRRTIFLATSHCLP